MSLSTTDTLAAAVLRRRQDRDMIATLNLTLARLAPIATAARDYRAAQRAWDALNEQIAAREERRPAEDAAALRQCEIAEFAARAALDAALNREEGTP
jgi:hypothetical protein